jgi:ATP-dependent DNA ligase
LEGVIAMRADSVYVSKHSRDWMKFKCWEEQEFVIANYSRRFRIVNASSSGVALPSA